MLQNESLNLELGLEDFVAIRDFIHEKSGIYFAENKKYLLENRLGKRMATLGIKSYRDYFFHIKYDTTLKEFNILMTLVTTNETSFYRNPPQLVCFQEEVLPLMIEQKKRNRQPKRIKIWSAGCSTGEEPYTLGMILLDVLGERTDWSLEILANDISESVLYSARTACYTASTIRTTPPAVINRYFNREGEKYFVNDNVKRLVKFSHLNLVDRRKMALMTDIDIVFCRNVTIYFSDDVKRQIVKQFYSSLHPGGYMFIGHAESLHGISKAFKLVYFKNGLVYHKEVTSQVADQDSSGTSAEAKGAIAISAAVSSAGPAGDSMSPQKVAGGNGATMEKLKKIQELLASARK